MPSAIAPSCSLDKESNEEEQQVENIMSSKLFTTRQGTVLLGVIAAVIAAIALLVFLNSYRSSVNATVQVLVAKKTIPQGMSGDVLAKTTGLYVLAPIAKGDVMSGAITDTSTLSGKVALADITPNSQLTESQFGAASGVVTKLGPNERAVVVSLGSPQSVGGQIAAGSHVDFWVTTSGQGAGGVTRPIAKLLFQNVLVLGVDGGNVTLEASPTQSGQIIYASTNDSIWLALRPTIATKTKPPVIGSVTGG
jgi:Flp pilus assembly protein CpaB